MKYVSIDIETTGLDPRTCQILEFGAIFEDSKNPLPFEETPRFHAYIKRDFIQGEPYALNMNAGIIKTISEGPKADTPKGSLFLHEDELARYFSRWLFCIQENHIPEGREKVIFGSDAYPVGDGPTDRLTMTQKIVPAGKNFTAFDLKFLVNLPLWNDYVKLDFRALDPGSLCTDFDSDRTIPSLQTCRARVGIADKTTAHTAIEDAWDVIEILRHFYPRSSRGI